MKKSKTLWLAAAVAALLTVGTTTAALASAKKNFCSVINAIDIPGKNKLSDDVATISLAFTGMNGILSGLFVVDQVRAANAHTLEVSTGRAVVFKPLQIFSGAVKAFLRSFIPYSQRLAELLLGPDRAWTEVVRGSVKPVPNPWKKVAFGSANQVLDKSLPTSYAKFFKAWTYLYRGWLALVTAVTALRLAALPVCDKVKAWCGKKSDKTCALPAVDSIFGKLAFWQPLGGRRVGQTACAAPSGLEALTAKYQGTLAKIAADSGKLSAFIRKWAPQLKGLAKSLDGVDSVVGKARKAMDLLKKALAPVKVALGAVDSVMNKKLCIIKGTCFRLKEIPKKLDKIKKYSKKLTKGLMKQADKLIDSIVKKVTQNLPSPGLDGLAKTFGKLGGVFGKLFDLHDGLGAFMGLPLNTYASDLRSMASALAALK